MAESISLSPRIIDQIKEGKAILFLGAGASYGCTSINGERKALTGAQLGVAISEKFLGGKRSAEALAKIADYATSDSSVLDVQNFIKQTFESIEPQEFHKLIPLFKWRAIVTTNYDRVVEKAYEQTQARIQNPLVIIQDGDLRAIEDTINAVPIFKIHGCISRVADTNIPLIIANEQYAKYQDGRSRLITAFKEMAKDHPVIFCGYEIADPHIAQILFSLENGFQDRPSYAAINPRFDDLDKRYWGRFKMETVSATFEEFLTHIDQQIDSKSRLLGSVLNRPAGAMSRWLKTNAMPSHNLQAVIGGRLIHVHHEMLIENPNPINFYRGDSATWAPIKSGYDFDRNITSQILANIQSPNTEPKLVLIKGHAGAGKSVTLKRVAWELSGSNINAFCFFCDTSLKGVRDILDELYELSGERIFIAVDNGLFDAVALNECYVAAKKKQIPVTFIVAVRTNEWNSTNGTMKLIPAEEYSLGDLSHDEADMLCTLLDEHGCLGELKHLAHKERVDTLMSNHERQLLVALHEATLGADLRKILRDEYRNISPLEAQILYLDICSLHRLNVPVRAGLVSRMSGTNFIQFEERFFSPLEKVVSAYSDWRSKDFAYKTRHTEIAQIVFDEAFPTPVDKANQLVRILSVLNSDYSSDSEAASKILKGRVIADDFADRSLAERIFESAEQAGIDQGFVFQQRALFELKHPGGSAIRALKFIDQALELPRGQTSSIHHTKAVVLRDLARGKDMEPSLAVRYQENALAEVKDHGLLKTSYGVVTYCEVLMDQVKTRIENGPDLSQKLSEEVAVRKMSELERNIAEGLQRWPDDTYLVSLRHQLFTVLNEHPQALLMLRKAYSKTPANEFVALRLSRQLMDSDDPIQIAEAKKILHGAVSQNASSKALNFQLARLLIREDESTNAQEISKLLRRSFTDGDTHFEAQFYSARHEFLFGSRERANQIYSQLNSGPVPYGGANEKRGTVRDSSGTYTEFEGSIKTLKGDFCFVECPSLGSAIFLSRNELKGASWSNLRPGDSLKFKVAFSYRGPCCIDAHA